MKPSQPKGMRDFLPQQVGKRRFITQTIQTVFEKYGFQGIETPVMENLETLTGKYGDEGDKLLFKVLNSGDFKSKLDIISIEKLFNYVDRVLFSFFITDFNIEELINVCEGKFSILSTYLNLEENNFSREVKNLLSRFISENKEKIISNRVKFHNKHKLYNFDEDKNSSFLKVLKNHSNKYYVTFVYDFLKKITNNSKISTYDNIPNYLFTKQISEKGLRYDLTVPLARYVVQNQNELVFPFKRFHIAPVWRADRPQKGRYREFYQCDADVIGSESLINEVELAKIYAEVFNLLKIDVTIKLNSRKILTGLLNYLQLQAQTTAIIVEIDKLDKIGKAKVLENIQNLGVNIAATQLIEKVLLDQSEVSIQKVASENEEFAQGLNEVKYIEHFNIPNLEIDFSLARGLDYYTGCIFEVKCNDYEIGSIGGGGRYDNLTEMFGKKDLTGVGISFGLERIYDIMEALEKFPESLSISTKLMFVHFDENTLNYAFNALEEVRKAGIKSEIYPDITKLKKQMNYANDKQIEYVSIIGEDEMKSGKFSLKHMKSGDQQQLDLTALIDYLKKQ